MDNQEFLNQPLTEANIVSMLMTLAAEFSARCAEKIQGLQPHITAGADIYLKIQVTPRQRIDLILENSDGKKMPLAYKVFDLPSSH
jgi:hypothetical protein